ncbi:MAG: DUF6056 family protein [Xenococcus sp. MO_188.B8]|nr:DUF6056 family protein [Xenococcus sp. MO_188.B8]
MASLSQVWKFRKVEKISRSNSMEPRNLYFNIALVILFITIIPYLFLALFSVPAGDDFVQASNALEKGVFGYVKWRYFNWNGRYTSDFIIAFYNILGNKISQYFLIKFFFIVPLSLLSCYVGANYFFLKILFKNNQIRFNIIYALIATISIISNTLISQSVFWLAGGTAYGLASSLFIISFAITIYTLYLSQNYSFLFFINALIISFINGLSETIMVVNTTFIIVISILNIVIFSRAYPRRFSLKNVSYSVIVLISALIVYMAPGNANRSSGYAQRGDIVLSLGMSIHSTFDHVFKWINPFWICLFVLGLFISCKLPNNRIKNLVENRKILTIIFTSLVASLYMSYFVRWYSTGHEGVLRADTVSYTIFFIITVILSICLGVSLNSNNLVSYVKTERVFLFAITTFCCLSIAINYPQLKNDFQILKRHYEYYQTNYSLAIKAKSGSNIELLPEPRAKILRYSDDYWGYLQNDKQHPINKGFARYFNLNSVMVLDQRLDNGNDKQ